MPLCWVLLCRVPLCRVSVFWIPFLRETTNTNTPVNLFCWYVVCDCAECCYVECHCAEWCSDEYHFYDTQTHLLTYFDVSVIVLNVVMQSVIMLNDVKLNAVFMRYNKHKYTCQLILLLYWVSLCWTLFCWIPFLWDTTDTNTPVSLYWCCVECYCAECYYAECRYAECCSAECRFVKNNKHVNLFPSLVGTTILRVTEPHWRIPFDCLVLNRASPLVIGHTYHWRKLAHFVSLSYFCFQFETC